MFKPKTIISGRFGNSSGDWIRTNDLRVMSKNPKSVPFVRRVLQISQTCERWFNRARHATVVDRCAYGSPFTEVRQVFFWFPMSIVPVCLHKAQIETSKRTDPDIFMWNRNTAMLEKCEPAPHPVPVLRYGQVSG